jgi:SAM-dependent methyltransferase
LTRPTEPLPGGFARYAADLEQVIWQVARRALGRRARQQRELARQILELSSAYNEGRPPPPSEESVLARLTFFTLADLPKAAFPLAELLNRDQLSPAPGEPLRVLDLGAGCGTLTLGLLGLLHAGGLRWPLSVTAVDRDRRALALMQQVLDRARHEGLLPGPLSLHVRGGGDLLAGAARPGVPPRLIMAGGLINELPPAARLPLLRSLLGQLAPGGQLLLLEPALRSCSRALCGLRDQLLAEGAATVFAPCTRDGPCPALLREGDWCHERRSWRPTPELQRLATATGLRRRDLKWSYITLNRHGARVHQGRPPGAFRVVSRPRRTKGKLEVYLCGPPGRPLWTRLQRHRAPDNAAFGRLRRGQLAWIDDPAGSPESPRIAAATRVTSEDPAGSGWWRPGGDGG